MSKLLKRTLALALIFCLVLSVIPAVSAVDTQPDVKAYTLKSYKNLTAANYETNDIRYVNHCSVQNDNGVNYFNVQHAYNQAAWGVFVINVKEAGTYQVTTGFNGGQYRGKGEVWIVPWTQELEQAAIDKGTNNPVWAPTAITNATPLLRVNVDTTLTYQNNLYEQAYLGEVQIPAAGDYIVMFRNNGVGAAAGASLSAPAAPAAGQRATNAIKLTDITLHKGTATDAITYAMNKIAPTADYAKSYGYAVTLCTDVTVTDLAIPQGVRIELNGKTLTANSVVAKAGYQYAEHAGYVRDYLQTGSLNSQTVQFESNVEGLPLYNGNGYSFVKARTAVTPGAEATKTNPYEVEEGTMRFGFDVALPEEAYAYVKNEKAPMKILFTVKVGDDKAKTYEFDEIDQDWIDSKSEGKAFYVDIKGIDQLDPETTVVLTPYIQVLNAKKSCGTITYTTPAA